MTPGLLPQLGRVSPWVYEGAKALYAATYPQHRLSFRRWLERWLIESMELEEPSCKEETQ